MNRPSFREFENDILSLLGLEGQPVQKIILILEANKEPVVEIHRLVLESDCLVAKKYHMTEVEVVG